MDWHYLGHAMWLAQLGEVRVLFDPLLKGEHHGGVFEVEPERELEVGALEPDFVLVSHAHPDHFDVPSLRALAARDADAVLLTSDELVARTAKRLGFRSVRVLDTWSRVELLGGTHLLTTPSYEREVEWGVLVRTREGACWNQVDSFHPEPSLVEATLQTASRALGVEVHEGGLALALARWQPVLEVAAPLAEAPGFPYEEYARALARLRATRARALVPSAAGVRHRGPYAWMNHYVYPVPLERALRDLARVLPSARVLPPRVGGTYRVRGGETSFDPEGARGLVHVHEAPRAESTRFRPVEMPALRDPNLQGREEGSLREVVAWWVQGELARGLARAAWCAGSPLRLVLEVVYPQSAEAYTLCVEGGEARVERRFEESYDVLNVVAGSLLVDVLEGRRCWADPLLGGMLRVVHRAYEVEDGALRRRAVEPLFLYAGLSYEQSLERAVEWQLRSVGA